MTDSWDLHTLPILAAKPRPVAPGFIFADIDQDDACTFDLRPFIEEAISKIHVAVEADTIVKVVAALEKLGYTVVRPKTTGEQL